MAATEHPQDGRRRVVIAAISPEVDCGRFPAKRVIGETLNVEADVLADGHDLVAAALRVRHDASSSFSEVRMRPLGHDRFRASVSLLQLGRIRYTVVGWVDHFRTWRSGLGKKVRAGQDIAVDLLVGAELVAAAISRASGEVAVRLQQHGALLADTSRRTPERVAAALDEELAAAMDLLPDRSASTVYPAELEVVVDPERARFSSWYELFPRSAAATPGRHGTLADVEARLPYVARLGFDVLYLPPIHPIGRSHRKGPNNRTTAAPEDPGSPWAIGAAEGGHTAVHPELGTVEDFARLVARARDHGIDIAMDLAYQCAPDHPWISEHPEWFKARPDGTIQHAENPPKKYEDIVPLDFETAHWRELWAALKGVVDFWIGTGVRIFRVDNPHTKAFPFWEWLIAEVKAAHPEVIFLSEAFTRPKVMHRLAKLGFTQSYTYFAWRNAKWEIEQYFKELSQPAVRDFFRANLWPNTPDILTETLQTGGRPAFLARLVLAATLGASYGIYGPPFELMEARAREWGSEEYLDSEKYQVRHWDLDRTESLADIIALVNRIRRENTALQTDAGLHFHTTDNDALICYSKRSDDGENVILTVVNLDPYHPRAGWLDLDLEALGVAADEPFQMHDLIGGGRYLWSGAHNYTQLDPAAMPAHIFRVRRRLRTERDFEYFL